MIEKQIYWNSIFITDKTFVNVNIPVWLRWVSWPMDLLSSFGVSLFSRELLWFQITLGRATKDNQIDVDLSLEGPAWKISRRQGIIKLRNNGDFFIANEGKRPFYVDGKAILAGNKQKLNNNSVVEVSCGKLISYKNVWRWSIFTQQIKHWSYKLTGIFIPIVKLNY